MTRLALIGVAGILLSGCGWSQTWDPPHRSHHGVHSPPLVVAARGLDVNDLPRFLTPTQLAIVTWGSSSCPSVPDELMVETSHRIRLHLTVGSWDGDALVAHPPPGGVCTEDWGPTPMIVTIDPTLIDVHSPVTIRVFSQQGTNPEIWTAAPLDGHAPRPSPYPVVIHSPVVESVRAPLHVSHFPLFVSQTRLAIVTMGSSSCPSVPDELVVLGQHAIRIHLTVGSWDNGALVPHSPGACTADYGPTQMLVEVDPELLDVYDPVTIRVFYNDSNRPEVWTAAPLGS